ncbi:hypothetical protein [Haloarcula regularis]|uniref:hypothetical protein n=1 Tax=Haloarcula regularis TaxID=3033392 RepID=UPI0023E78B15|nr:hypothetical protein [Halomicroarcula sp. SYNS111]
MDAPNDPPEKVEGIQLLPKPTRERLNGMQREDYKQHRYNWFGGYSKKARTLKRRSATSHLLLRDEHRVSIYFTGLSGILKDDIRRKSHTTTQMSTSSTFQEIKIRQRMTGLTSRMPSLHCSNGGPKCSGMTYGNRMKHGENMVGVIVTRKINPTSQIGSEIFYGMQYSISDLSRTTTRWTRTSGTR